MTLSCNEEAFPGVFLVPNTGILSEKVPAHSLPFWDLLVMMKPQSLELHPSKNRFGGRALSPTGQSTNLDKRADSCERLDVRSEDEGVLHSNFEGLPRVRPKVNLQFTPDS
jgi:hypothetical protein